MLSLSLQLILLVGCTQALEGCQSIVVQNRTSCFINGEISLGSTCANTVGASVTTQLTIDQTLDLLEARPALDQLPAHAPAVFQSAADYGEETIELETACRLLGNSCSYALQSTVKNHKKVLQAVKALIPQ